MAETRRSRSERRLGFNKLQSAPVVQTMQHQSLASGRLRSLLEALVGAVGVWVTVQLARKQYVDTNRGRRGQ